jgi:asparagine synthase (glutamine-hydrolysing)
MSGLCGYVGAPLSLEAIRSAGQPLQALADGTAALAICAHEGGASLHQEAGLLAAVWGPATLDGHREQLAARLCLAWRTRGPQACAELSGHFAVCIIDSATGQALLAIDRSGVHAMHYRADAQGLQFGSSATALPKGELDPQALFNYLYFHTIPAPHSVYRHQHRLLPGGYLLYRRGSIKCGFYWNMRFHEQHYLPFKQMKQQFLGVLQDSVRQAAQGEVGAFLSGGTDSSTLAGMLAKLGDTPPRTYSIGFEVEGYDEMAYARLAARHFRTRHHEYYLTAGDVADAIPQLAAACDQPFGNSSIVPAYFCAQMARADGVTRLIGGDGGDELFGGNERYALQAVFARYEQLPSSVRQLLLEPLLFGLAGRVDLPPVRKARRYVEQALTPMPARMESYNLLRRYGPAQVLDRDFLASVDENAPLAQLHACYWEANGLSQINRMQALDLRYTLADNDLRKVTTACELAGVTAAFPFLSDDMLAFSARLSPRDKLNGTQLRYFFKQALREHLPRAILRKKKHGFGMPFGQWLLKDARLRSLAYDSLSDLKARRIVQPAFIDDLTTRLVHEHPAYHSTMVWVLMMLEQWLSAHSIVAPAGVAESVGYPAPTA